MDKRIIAENHKLLWSKIVEELKKYKTPPNISLLKYGLFVELFEDSNIKGSCWLCYAFVCPECPLAGFDDECEIYSKLVLTTDIQEAIKLAEQIRDIEIPI